MTKTSVWVGTSWKMNKTLAEAMVFADGRWRADAPRDQASSVSSFRRSPPRARSRSGLPQPASRSAPRTCIGTMPAPGPVKSRQ
jgi:hypothetical protein